MIEAGGLTKRYGAQLDVDDGSFRCEPGTVTLVRPRRRDVS